MACRGFGEFLCGSCQPFSCSVSAWAVLMASSLVKHCCVLAECGQRSEEWGCGRAQKLPLYLESELDRKGSWVGGIGQPQSCCAAPDELVYAKGTKRKSKTDLS